MPHTLPPDPGLPHLATALDSAAMLGVFQDNLLINSDSNSKVIGCSLYRFRYRNSTRAITLYEVLLADGNTGKTQQQWVTGSIFKGGKAGKLAKKYLHDSSANEMGRTDTALPGYSYIHGLEMFVQCFPMDRHLPELEKIMRHCDPAVHTLLMQQFGSGDWQVEQEQIAPVRYRPGVGATMHSTIQARNKENDKQETQSAYLKVYRSHDPVAAFNSLTLLSEAAERSNAAFAVPAPIGYSEETGTLAIAPAAGQSLEDLLLLEGDTNQFAQRSAQALYAFHMSEAPITRKRSKEGSLARANKAVNFIKWACPELSWRVDRIYNELDKRLVDDIYHPAHLDLKADHIFLDDNIVTFIDMDSAACADPVLDPAMLLARLHVMPDLLPVSHDRMQTFAEEFTEHYFALAPSEWRMRLGPAYACSALKVALYFVQHLEQNWRQKIAKTLSLAEDYL